MDITANGVIAEGISNRQEKNLRRLAAYLAALPPDYGHFDMQFYLSALDDDFKTNYGDYDSVGEAGKVVAECGTVACAIGHGPAAGIKPQRDECWYNYATRVTGLHNDGFSWCFSGNWSARDNTPLGAAERITVMLDNKALPDDANSQRYGQAPLSYKGTPVPTLEKLGLA
jgi:hypothetical protein